MTDLCGALLASFTSPMHIDTDPASMLWLLPLVVSIVVVYKATKVHKIQPYPFFKESAVLFGSILVFIIAAALILWGVAWIVTDRLPSILNKPTF